MTFRIGVIGCGWVSTACHGPAYSEYAALHPEVELAACCDIETNRVENFRLVNGFQRAYLSYQEMLDSESLSVVCLNVPPGLICEIGCKLLQRGIPLLTEKPPGLTIMEIDRLIEIAKAGNVPHQVAFNRRFSPLVTELKRLLSDSPVSHIDYILSRVGRDHEDFSTTAIHAIDTTRFIAGSDFHEVQIYHQENQGEHGFYLNQQLNGQLANGASFHITICPSSGIVLERATVYCNDQTFFISNNLGPDSPGQIQYYQKGHLIAEINGESFCGRRDDYYLNGFYHEDARFFDLIQAGLPAPNDFLSARQSVALMQALQEKRTVFINGCL